MFIISRNKGIAFTLEFGTLEFTHLSSEVG
jgi:hypothetical protein